MSKFDDDMARGCLPTGEPLECLYGVGWWTERDEPEPDPYDLHIAELESRIAELSQAVGLITTLKPTMVMDANHPLDMVREVREHVTARIAELEAEKERER